MEYQISGEGLPWFSDNTAFASKKVAIILTYYDHLKHFKFYD